MKSEVKELSAKKAQPNVRRADGIQSVDRALTILEIIAASGGNVPLAEIAESADLNSSTCHHILKTLVSRQYVAAGSTRGTYSLSSQILLLAGSVNWNAGLAQRAQPLIDHLNNVTGEAVHLAMLEGTDLVTVVKREALHAVRVDAGSIGKSGACHATATGKAILAWLSDDEVTRILDARGLQRFTPKTITDRAVLFEDLKAIKQNGYSVDDEEFQPHVRCIGAPVFDHNGAVIGSISVSTPVFRASDEHMALVRREVTAATSQLSGRRTAAEPETSEP